MIHAVFSSGEEVVDFEVAAGDDVVVAEQDACDGAEEYLVRGKERDED